MTANRLRAALLTFLVLLTTSCGAGNSSMVPLSTPACVPSTTPEFAYVLTGYAVAMFTVGSCTGDLTPTMPASVASGPAFPSVDSEGMVADPLGRFAYVANLVSNGVDDATVSMFTIDSVTGVLTPTTPPTVHTGFYPQGIGIDPAGKFVYTANSDDNTISMFTINPSTGVLIPTSPAAVMAGWSPLSVTVHPSGKFAYAANQDDDTVSMYTVNQTTGILTPMTPASVPTDNSPFQVTIDPSGKFAYVPNAYSANKFVSQYTIDPATGVLTPNTPPDVAAGNQPASVAVDPSSRFAYVVNRQDSTVSMFTINSGTGNLTPNGTVDTGAEPFRITFDPSGQFVYVADEASALSIYTLNPDGTLAFKGAVSAASGALSIAITKANQ